MATLLAYLYLRLVVLTARIRVNSSNETSLLMLRERRLAIFTFWNEDMYFLSYYFGARRMPLLIAALRKKDRLTRLARLLGCRVASGSAEGGGRHALMLLMDQLKAGQPVALPADGPHAALRRCKAGCLFLAQGSHLPLLPIAWWSRFRFRIKTLHGPLQVPLPFTRIVVRVGNPVLVPPHFELSELDGVKAQIEGGLNRLKDRT